MNFAKQTYRLIDMLEIAKGATDDLQRALDYTGYGEHASDALDATEAARDLKSAIEHLSCIYDRNHKPTNYL